MIGAAPVPVPAAHTSGDEAHMRAGKVVNDLFDAFFGGGSTDGRTGPLPPRPSVTLTPNCTRAED